MRLEERDEQIRAWLAAAREGSSSSLGELLETCRNYLLLVANQTVDVDLQAKVAPSDLVQETFLRAQRSLKDFDGSKEAELLAWLRRILLNQIYDARRDFDAQKRQVEREAIVHPSDLPVITGGRPETPSSLAVEAEQRKALEDAMARLPEEYRQVVMLRNWERRSFADIGVLLGRSDEAARKLWGRAIEKLQELLRQSR
jgi:RNA polymerase sigma-70 factor (ECF subfamily)